MKMNVYSVFDKKAAIYAHPFYMQSDAVAIRAFGDAVNKDSMFNAHPEDYSMYRIGSFDDAFGKLEAEAPPVVLCEAVQFIKPVVKAIEEVK